MTFPFLSLCCFCDTVYLENAWEMGWVNNTIKEQFLSDFIAINGRFHESLNIYGNNLVYFGLHICAPVGSKRHVFLVVTLDYFPNESVAYVNLSSDLVFSMPFVMV